MLGIPKAFGERQADVLIFHLDELGLERDKLQVLIEADILHVYELVLAIQGEEDIDQEVINFFGTYLKERGFVLEEELSDNLIEILDLLCEGKDEKAREVFQVVMEACSTALKAHQDNEQELAADLAMMGSEDLDQAQQMLEMAPVAFEAILEG